MCRKRLHCLPHFEKECLPASTAHGAVQTECPRQQIKLHCSQSSNKHDLIAFQSRSMLTPVLTCERRVIAAGSAWVVTEYNGAEGGDLGFCLTVFIARADLFLAFVQPHRKATAHCRSR